MFRSIIILSSFVIADFFSFYRTNCKSYMELKTFSTKPKSFQSVAMHKSNAAADWNFCYTYVIPQ